MAEVVRSEPPVLIENVNLVINVFNVNPHANNEVIPIASPLVVPPPQGLIQQNGLIQSSTTSAATISSAISRSLNASFSLQKPPGEPESSDTRTQSAGATPLGWIVRKDGKVLPFGVQPTALEMKTFGDRGLWTEIRVCLPPSLLADNETDWWCPVAVCREKLPRNKSMDSHIKKHLGFNEKESLIPAHLRNVDGALPCSLTYYCYDNKCQYYVETAEKNFKAYKNLKQHYQKVHAPRLFECDQCQKTFSIQKVLETHKLMCGEKYTCSTCDAAYDTLESLQTHCRRKSHTYDYNKYKDRKNSVKQEIQSQKCTTGTAPSPPTAAPVAPGRRAKSQRKLPTILPKGTAAAPPEVLSSVQALCQQAGLKIDLGCQTIYTAFIQKTDPVKTEVPVSSTSAFTQKKRKSTDTQTNIVKFRATCLDQKHNATNTNLDWKKVITSDSQTQTADSCDATELSPVKPIPDSSHFNNEFATFKISETSVSDKDSNSGTCGSLKNINGDATVTASNDTTVNIKEECSPMSAESPPEQEEDVPSVKEESKEECKLKPQSIKVDNGPSLHSEFISFLEATDSATQTDPDMFDTLGSGECLGIRNLFGDDLAGGTEDAHYVSVSSTASQTAVESVTSKSLSAEDYEALLNTTDDKKIIDLTAFSDYIKTVEGINQNNNANSSNSATQSGTVMGGVGQHQGTNDFVFDWEHIVEEVYRDVGDASNK